MYFDEGVPTVDLFAGAGGLSLGFAAAGFDVAAAAEWDDDACDTFEKHHPLANVVRGDLGEPDSLAALGALKGSVRVVVGGPPCQPWSSGGKRLGPEDPRDGFPLFLRVLRLLGRDVEAFVMENVSGIQRGSRREHYEALLSELRQLGFVVSPPKEVNAADYGVPQNRRRVIAVGLRGQTFKFPEPSHGPGRPSPWVTSGSVLSTRHTMGTENTAIVTYARFPDLRPSPYDGHVYNGGGRPIDLSRPAPTLLASMGGNKTPWLDTMGIAPEYHAALMAGLPPRSGLVPGARRITVEEAALLQTFPEGLEFAGRKSSQYRQVGNAVPPLLAHVVGAALREQLS